MNDIQRRSAVIVGVSSYQDGLNDLPNTKNDAARLAHVLTERCSFDPDRVYLLTDDKDGKDSAPTKPNILAKIKYLINSSEENDVILFFFAGHGTEVSGSPYLITADTRLNILDDSAINVSQLNDKLEESKAQFVIRIFDACRTSSGLGRAMFRGMTSDLQAALLKRVTGWATLSACSSGQYAWEDTDTEHGVFSRYLCEGLEGKAADSNAQVTLEGLVNYVKGAIEAWGNQRAKEQVPQFQVDISGQLVFSQATQEPETTPAPFGEHPSLRPMAFLAAELDHHLGSLPPDVRDATLTSSPQIDQIADSVHASLLSHLETVHSTLRVALGKFKRIELGAVKKNPPWNTAHKMAETHEIAREWQGIRVLRVRLDSTQATIPNSALHIAVVRFTFFFWIWWALVCDPKSMGRTFEPSPSTLVDFRTLVPHAALDKSKVEDVIGTMLAQSSEQVIEWSKQLAEFIDKTVDPLRQLSDIIK